MKFLSLSIPNAQGTPVQVSVPNGIPTGGLETGGAGQKLISGGIQLLFVGATILSLFYLIWAGIDWMRSEGDKTAIESARHKLTYAILGLIVVFLSILIVQVIATFFNVPLLGVFPS